MSNEEKEDKPAEPFVSRRKRGRAGNVIHFRPARERLHQNRSDAIAGSQIVEVLRGATKGSTAPE